jgi:hypothetical protein
MVVSSSRLAFSDCFDLLEQAINDQKGIKVKFDSYDDAFNFRLRLHSARRIDRTENMQMYPEGHPMHGRSVYDPITCRIRKFDGGAWLRLERTDAREFEVESLSEPEEEPELALGPAQTVQVIVPIKPLRRRL